MGHGEKICNFVCSSEITDEREEMLEQNVSRQVRKLSQAKEGEPMGRWCSRKPVVCLIRVGRPKFSTGFGDVEICTMVEDMRVLRGVKQRGGALGSLLYGCPICLDHYRYLTLLKYVYSSTC